MHILWISIVEHVSELSLITTNRRRKHLGCPRASQQIWKLYRYKAHNSTWKSAMPAWAEYYSQRQIFSNEFCFLIASKIENVRWWENETHAPQIFRSLDVFSYTHTQTAWWNCDGCSIWAGIVFLRLLNPQPVFCSRSIQARGKRLSKSLYKLLTGISLVCKREKRKD